MGDLVLAFNEETGEIAPQPVTDLIRPQPKPLYAIEARDAGDEVERFHATDDHPWRVHGRGWVETANLRSGDRIDTSTEDDLVVTALTLTHRIEQTYNLTVANWHTFLVGEDQAVVHNADCTVGEVLRQRKGSIQRARLPSGSPSWLQIRDMTMSEVRRRAAQREPGYRTILKLLTDNRFRR